MNDIRICFIGDSLVNGACDPSAQGWVGRVCEHTNKRLQLLSCYNLGIRGATSTQIIKRWFAECEPRLPHSCDGRIVASFGINDTARVNNDIRIPLETSVNNLRQLIAQSHNYPLLMLGPPPVLDEEHNKRLANLSDRFRHECSNADIAFINLYQALSTDTGYLQDISNNQDCHPQGYHPGSKGYEKIANIILSSPQWWFSRAR